MNKKKRKILFISERRADYSRLKPIMKAVQKSNKLELQLLVAGAHLLKNYGETKKVIEKDGFNIDATLPLFTKEDKDDGASMARAFGKAVIHMPEIFIKLRPDIVFCGFDIGAHLAAAIVGMHLNIHVAHIQGGEVSGTIDEVIRHACTKLAHFHFAATKQSRDRIIKMGEDKHYVYNVGSPSLDTIKSIKYLPKGEIVSKFGLDPDKKTIILLQHPVTTEEDKVISQIDTTIKAIHQINKKYNTQTLAIYSNNDTGGKRIVSMLKKSDIKVVPHIVFEDFLRLLNVADVLIGNSSAGIHEAPSFGLPTINIGTRQQFRERGNNVLDVPHKKESVKQAIEKSLFDKRFIKKVKNSVNPYDNGKTSMKIVKILETIKLPSIQKVITY
jgi:GDP/UDP-N,N'-diacetylbacillosamine 2-epimerase (hydrolysing)